MAATECIVQRTAGYTVMSNHHLRDKRLSLKAKGLLSVILSLPEDWDYTIAGLALICDCGRDMIRAAIQELEKAGYISRMQVNESGKFGGNQYVIREIPVEQSAEPLPGFPTTENPPTKNPLPGNPTQINKEILNTDLSITDKSNTDKTTPRKARTAAKDTEFDRFWAEYPRKTDKKKARAAFGRVKVPLETLLDALRIQKASDQWQRNGGRYIPHPTTWLNGERWNDATPETKTDRRDLDYDELEAIRRMMEDSR